MYSIIYITIIIMLTSFIFAIFTQEKSRQARTRILFFYLLVLSLLLFGVANSQQIQPRQRIVKLDSTEYVKRGVYNMYLSWPGGCSIYPNYYSRTWKKKTIFSPYYFLIKTRKGWKLQPV